MSFLSFLDISLRTANKFYSLGWKSSLVGAFITLIGITLLMWGTRARDHDFEHLRVSQSSKDAADATENAKKIEQENLILRTDLNAAAGEVAKLQTKAANAQRELLELQERFKPRHLTAEQRTHLVALLTKQPKGTIGISSVGSNEEAFVLAQELYSALQEAGWKVEGINMVLLGGPQTTGLFLRVDALDSPLAPLVRVLWGAFQQVGLKTVNQVDPSVEKNKIVLIVAAKP